MVNWFPLPGLYLRIVLVLLLRSYDSSGGSRNFEGGVRGHPPLEENLKFEMMFSRPICLNFCQHLTTRRAMDVNELSSISKTKVPIQDSSAAAVAIAIILICNNYYYAWRPF